MVGVSGHFLNSRFGTTVALAPLMDKCYAPDFGKDVSIIHWGAVPVLRYCAVCGVAWKNLMFLGLYFVLHLT